MQHNHGQLIVCSFNCSDFYLIDKLVPKVAKVRLASDHAGECLALEVLERPGGCSTALLHFDISDWDRILNRRELLCRILEQRGVAVWNGRIASVRKSVLQQQNKALGLPHTAIEATTPPHCPVIVKTDLNAKGWPERRHAASTEPDVDLDRLRPLYVNSDYRVVKLEELDPATRSDPVFHIERYVANADRYFSTTFFVGQHCVLFEANSPLPVQRMDGPYAASNDVLLTTDMAGDQSCYDLLGEMRANAFRAAVRFATAFGLDYGSINQVFDDAGTAYIVDVNPTPYWGNRPISEPIGNHLRKGLPALGAASAGEEQPAPPRRHGMGATSRRALG